MSKDIITGRIIQNRVANKIQFQTSFTNLPMFINYCRLILVKGKIPKAQIGDVLGNERKKSASKWNTTHDSHACISLTQYNLIKIVDNNYYSLDLLGEELLSLYDNDNNLIVATDVFYKFIYKMLVSWHQMDNNFDVHPGLIIIKLLLSPELHGYITSQDIAHIFNNTDNHADSQFNDMLSQVISFRESAHLYNQSELKKTYTLLTGYVKWGIFNLDNNSSNSTMKVVSMKDEFKRIVLQELKLSEDTVLSDDEYKSLIESKEDCERQIEKISEKMTLKYGEAGKILLTYEGRISQVQTAFRNRLIKQFGQKCMLCEITNKELLIASHIKSNCVCTNIEEKIDNNNGFLLCANHDKLFDRFLISFDGATGKIMISKNLTNEEKRICMLDVSYVLPAELLTAERQMFLIWHNSEFVKKENGVY